MNRHPTLSPPNPLIAALADVLQWLDRHDEKKDAPIVATIYQTDATTRDFNNPQLTEKTEVELL